MSMSELKKSTPMLPSAGSPFGPPTGMEVVKRLSTKRGRDNRIFTLTQDIIGTYKRCNPAFKAIEVLPQRILTVPSEGAHNGGRDNEDSNLICRVNDTFAMDGYTFTILDLLGTGTFGQVFRCIRSDTKDIVAVKVVKNKPAYHAQGLLEIKVARLLNRTHDPNDERHIVRLLDSFEYYGHVCLVFELLSVSLLDVLTQNQFRGLPLVVVQRFTRQILTALVAMEEADVIHCDLKPENILLVPSHSNPSSPARRAHQAPAPSECDAASSNKDSSCGGGGGGGGGGTEAAAPGGAGVEGEASGMGAKTSPGNPARRSSGGGGVSDIKVIDFGSACFEGQTMYSYIQSRFYRSPEVLLGLPYNGAIDMWSLACVCAEMYLGLPLFPGVSQHNQLTRIVEMLGLPPDFLLEGKNGRKYFTAAESVAAGAGKDVVENSPQSVCAGSAGTSAPVAPGSTPSTGSKYRIKTAEEFAAETNTQVPVLRKYLRYNRLDEVIMRCPLPQKARMTPEQKNVETIRRRCFLDFLQGLFRLNPFERWTARQAFSHPFIENTMFVGPYVPPPDMKINERKLNFMVLTQRKPPPSTFEGVTLTGVRAPSNFSIVPGLLGGNSAQFTPLQLAQRRMSDPGLGSGGVKQASGPQLLKRGAPAHLASEQQQPKTSPGITAESAVPFSSTESESSATERTSREESHGRPPHGGLPPPVDHSASHVHAATRSYTDGVADLEKSAGPDTPPGGGSVARSIMRVNSKGRDLQNLASAMQQAAGSPTQQGQYMSQQAQYQQYAHQQQQQQQQSQSLQSSPQTQKYAQQYRQQQLMAQQAQQQSYLRQQQQAQQAQRGNVAFPPPPRPYLTAQPPMPPPQAQLAQNPVQYGSQPSMYPSYGGQMSSSMHADSPGMAMAGNAPGSSVGSSYNSYGYVGSMQDGAGGVILTDFALALMRPDMDEQRRLLSQTNQAPMYWQHSYAPGTSPGSLPAMGGAYGYVHGGHAMADPYPGMYMGGAPGSSYGYPMGAGPGDPRHGYYPAHPGNQQPQHQHQQLQQQQAGSFDSKTMHARRRQHQPVHQQNFHDRNNSANNLADMANSTHTAFNKSPAVPDAAEDSRSNNNNVKRLSGRLGQNKDSGLNRSGASLLQSSLQQSHADLRKPAPAYISKEDRPLPAAPPAQDATRHLPPPTSGVIKISAESGQKAPARADVVAGSYVDAAYQHTFHPLRHKDHMQGGGGGGSFLSMEIERRESFVAVAQPALGPSSPNTSASNSVATSNANSRQNSIDSATSPGKAAFGGIPHEKSGAAAGGSRNPRGSPGRAQKPGRSQPGAKRGDSNEDVLEEWHPFFEADAI